MSRKRYQIGKKVNYKVVERYRFSTKSYLIDVDVKNREVKTCICIFVIPYYANKRSNKEENNYLLQYAFISDVQTLHRQLQYSFESTFEFHIARVEALRVIRWHRRP